MTLHADRLVVAAAWTGINGWMIWRALRSGRASYFHVMFKSYYVDRDRHPFAYWLVLLLTIAIVALGYYFLFS